LGNFYFLILGKMAIFRKTFLILGKFDGK